MRAKAIIKNTLGGAIGNSIEWYDFAVFGFSAPITAKLFVSASDKLNALMYVYALFAIGFISRPLGSFLFGYIGDKYGRSRTLKLTIWFMSIPTVLIGLMPTYATLGILTPIIIALLRLLQGIAMGGEFTGSIIYLAEQAPVKKRGLFSSFGYISTTSGILIGSAIVTLNIHLFSSATILAWAWRIPFILSIVLCLVAYALRKRLPEPENIQRETKENPIVLAFKQDKRAMLSAIGLNFFNAVGFYTFFIFMVTYFSHVLEVGEKFSLRLNTSGLLLLILMMPISGYLADKLNRKVLLSVLTIILLIFLFPAFALMTADHSTRIILFFLGLTVLFGLIQGALPVTFVELFPPVTRASGLSISFNISNALFGGTAPLIATYLISLTHSYYALIAYLTFAMLVFILTALLMKKRK